MNIFGSEVLLEEGEFHSAEKIEVRMVARKTGKRIIAEKVWQSSPGFA